MKRSYDELTDDDLEEEVWDILYGLQQKKWKGQLPKDEEEKILKSIRPLPEDNPIYCDDDIESIEDYVADVEDYINFAEKNHKEELLKIIEV